MKLYPVLSLQKQALNHAEGEVPGAAMLSSWLHTYSLCGLQKNSEGVNPGPAPSPLAAPGQGRGVGAAGLRVLGDSGKKCFL